MVKQSQYKKRFTQKNYTRSLLELLGWSISRYSELYKTLWENQVVEESLRLSVQGMSFMNKNSIRGYEFKLNTPLDAKSQILLQRYFPSPFFYFSKTFIVYEEKEASMLILLDGDLRTYLKNIEE